MRDFKLKMTIIWLVLTDSYTSCSRDKCWWLWSRKEKIVIAFGEEHYYDINKHKDE